MLFLYLNMSLHSIKLCKRNNQHCVFQILVFFISGDVNLYYLYVK